MKTIIPLTGAAVLLASLVSVAEAQVPVIVTQPSNGVVLVGGVASFSVTVSGTGPFTYQWQLNGTNLPPRVIITVAGDDAESYSGDGGAATKATLNEPDGVAVDASGNLFIADYGNHCVRKVGTNGIITTVVGDGYFGYSADGVAATNAELASVTGVAVDNSGNLFIADIYTSLIRKAGTNGIITTVAGNGTNGYSGDGGAAINASLSTPFGVAVDASGNLFIADTDNNRIRKVGTNGIITTVAGNGELGYSGDGGAATSAEVYSPDGVAVDASGNLFIVDQINGVIRKVGSSGIITTVAGSSKPRGYSGDGGPATDATLNYPAGVAVDTSGHLFIADAANNRIREVGANGFITTIAGDGIEGYSGDGRAAANAELNSPSGVAADASGNVFVADYGNNRIRKVLFQGNSPSLVLANVDSANAGSYDVIVSNTYGSVTSSVVALQVVFPPTIATDPKSQVVPAGTNLSFSVSATGDAPFNYQWFFDGVELSGQTNSVLFFGAAYLTNAGGYSVVVTNLYGSATSSVATLVVAAIAAEPLSQGAAVGTNLTLNVITTGLAPYSFQWFFDGGMLTGQTNNTLSLNDIQLTNAGSYNVVVTNLYGSVTSAVAVVTVGIPPRITDQSASQVSPLDGAAAFSVAVSGPGPFAYQWQLNGVNLPDGIITTVAGNGREGYSGDGGAATNAALNSPNGVAADAFGNLFFADTADNVIRELETDGIITTVAGNGKFGYSGDGSAAAGAELRSPSGTAIDAFGNLYIADYGNNRIRKVGDAGIITTVAGNGDVGYSGDGRAAINAELNGPLAVVVDASGNLFIADTGNSAIRKVGTNGIITTVAGNSRSGDSGDGGPATNAALSNPVALALDNLGNLFIADSVNGVIREVGTNGIITTVAGNYTLARGYSGDGGPATNAALDGPTGVAVDTSGNLFIADSSNARIREVGTDGIITTVAGNGIRGYSGDGGPATNAELDTSVMSPGLFPMSVAIDATGNLIIADSGNERIRKVVFPGPTLALLDVTGANAGEYDVVVSSPYGSITSSIVSLDVLLPPTINTQPLSHGIVLGSNATLSVVAGGTAPLKYQWYFDGALLNNQTNTTLPLINVAFGNAGSYTVVIQNLYGSITSAEAGVAVGYAPGITEQPLSQTNLSDSTATFLVAVSGTGPFDYQWQFNGLNLPNGIITTAAGTGKSGYSGDGGAATNAELNNPEGVAVDASGNLFITDTGNERVRKVGTNGIVTTVAGNGYDNLGSGGYSGDGGPAPEAELNLPWTVAVDASGNLFIADTENQRIRKVGTDGIITTVAGNGKYGYSGDGSAAAGAELRYPLGVAADTSGNLFIADSYNNVIRKVGTNGIITTVAGNGIQGYAGDGGPATGAELFFPTGVAADASGNLFVSDTGNERIREVGTDGIIATVAGNGYKSLGYGGYSGDGSAAANAKLDNPYDVAVDAFGNLFVADTGDERVREVGADGIIVTVAGNGIGGYSGDGGASTNAELSYPDGVAVDASGNLFIADTENSRVRKMIFPGPALVLNNVTGTNAGEYDVVVSTPYGSVTSAVVTLSVLGVPVSFVTTPGGIEFTNGQLQLTLSGLSGQGPVLIEASTNLTQWTPVFTNPSGFGTIQFTDPATTNYRSRFYRVTTPGQ